MIASIKTGGGSGTRPPRRELPYNRPGRELSPTAVTKSRAAHTAKRYVQSGPGD